MRRLDLVCQTEELHRAKLLHDHMLNLGVELVIHEQTPQAPSDFVAYVVARGEATDADSIPAERRIALHFDKRHAAFSAACHAPLHTWPARSADVEVRKLVHQLHRLERSANEKSLEREAEPRPTRRDYTNVVALAAIVGTVALLALFLGGGQTPVGTPAEKLARPSAETTTGGVPATAGKPPTMPAGSLEPKVAVPAPAPPETAEPGVVSEIHPPFDGSTLGHFCRATLPEAKAAWYQLLPEDVGDHPCVVEFERSR